MNGGRSTGAPPRVVLIVDNPLRDLDGLVMLARELGRRGAEAYMAPMYDQTFVVGRVRPDVVVANYIRPNNAALLSDYRARGMRIVVVDTEGAAGRAAEDLAALLAHTGLADLADAYCVWGRRQAEAIVARGVLPEDRVLVTGCPRYDVAAPRWRGALAAPAPAPGFVLINTNFAAIAPRFSKGSSTERDSLVKLGLDADYVDDRLRDERVARQGIIDLVTELCGRFPDRHFVLRPHPFEDPQPYAALSRLPNASIRQEGTSLEWIASAAALIHLNCSTAVEAAMLDKPALSPAWLDTPALRIEGPSSVSRHVPDATAMIAILAACFEGCGLPSDPAVVRAADTIIRDTYRAIDGETAGRVAEVVMASAARDHTPARRRRGSAALATLRTLFGPRKWYQARALLRPGLRDGYAAKAPDPATVRALLQRLDAIDPSMVTTMSADPKGVAVGELIRITGRVV